MSPESLPVKLRQLRGTMSLSEAAERSQIPEQRIRMYEEGVRQPYGKTLKRLAEAYGVSVSEITGNGVVAPARQQPAPVRRRRRRRRAAALQGGERSIEVPVEVRPGEKVRIVIELIVRPAEGTAAGEAPVPTVALRTELVTDEAGAAPRPVPPAPASPPPPPPQPSWPAQGAPARPAHGVRRPHPGRAAADGGGHGGSPDVRDPLAEFRRAYGEFRRSRKP